MGAPIAIGTRGTIGSLLRKEIDYFKNINTWHSQLDQRRGNPEENTSTSQQRDHSSSWLSSWFSRTNWKKKKRQSRSGGGRYLPSMCSAAEVSGENRVPGFNYRILKSDD